MDIYKAGHIWADRHRWSYGVTCSSLNLSILEPPKGVLWQTMKILMKCHRMRYFVRDCTASFDKTILGTEVHLNLEVLTSVNHMFIVSIEIEEYMSIKRVEIKLSSFLASSSPIHLTLCILIDSSFWLDTIILG